ncbi:hypothetical protein IL306_010251 [Fusarium sp. DS 682]|nr:hypothetical protein IL306_010251 [Fusarium sp. DS 682]
MENTTRHEPKAEHEARNEVISHKEPLERKHISPPYTLLILTSKVIEQYFNEQEAVTEYCMDTNFLVNMTVEEGIRRAFHMYTSLSDEDFERATKEPTNALVNYENLMNIVAKRYKRFYPFTHRQPKVGMTFIRWMKEIRPMVHSNLQDLDQGDKMKQLLKKMNQRLDEVAKESGCFKQ